MPPDSPRLVDVNAEVDRVVRELVAAGFEDEDGDGWDDGRLDLHEGDGRL